MRLPSQQRMIGGTCMPPCRWPHWIRSPQSDRWHTATEKGLRSRGKAPTKISSSITQSIHPSEHWTHRTFFFTITINHMFKLQMCFKPPKTIYNQELVTILGSSMPLCPQDSKKNTERNPTVPCPPAAARKWLSGLKRTEKACMLWSGELEAPNVLEVGSSTNY